MITIRNHAHDGKPCDGPLWAPEHRCIRNGHRAVLPDHAPRQTRELPLILWPFEIASRAEAVLRGWLARRGRLLP